MKRFLTSFLLICALSVKAGEPTRLSDLLREQPLSADAYALGAVWTTPEEKARQALEHKLLEQELERLLQDKKLNLHQHQGLKQALMHLKPTGRVRLSVVNGRWLEASPQKDPVIQSSDIFRVGVRPEGVRVMTADGAVCEVRHREGFRTLSYAQACASQNTGSWAWVVQPDGRVQRMGLSYWNDLLQDQPAPGAWVWVPAGAKLDDEFNLRWAQWLATQGVSTESDGLGFVRFVRQVDPTLERTSRFDWRGRGLEPQPSSSTWGNAGLMQIPTARMRDAGYFGLSFSKDLPYSSVNVFIQPLKDLEVGFRYVNVAYQKYGSYELSGDQQYKDKSTDMKLRMLDESNWLPDVSVGMRDLTGTGLFSSEYLVASKRYGRFDFSGGMGWGYLGRRGNVSNPIVHVLGSQYDTRLLDFGQGGNFAAKSWFRGPAAFFGGVEYQSPWGVVVKVEYDGNNYKNEPWGKTLEVKSPINWGVVYRPWRGVDLSLGYERGNTISTGVTIYTDFATVTMPKVTDPAVPTVSRSRPDVEPNWEQTAQEIEKLTEWRVRQIYQEPSRVVVEADRTFNPAPQVRLDKALAVINRDAPKDVEKIEVQHVAAGAVLAVQVIDRDEWVKSKTEPARTMETELRAQPSYEVAENKGVKVLQREPKKYYVEPGLDFIQNLGGPDGFVLYQLSAAVNVGLKLPENFELRGMIRERLVSNYDKFKYDAPSNLPRVRTNLRSYYITSKTTMTNLTVSKAQRLSQSWYAGVYAGYFEPMFGGVGSEVLYRKPGSRWAMGLDINQVRQRNFEQDFGFQDYKIKTGHLTGYWMTPIEGVYTAASYGQYLAGDRGATVAVTKVFSNGSTMGAYVTKTNLSAQQFGEGSYDKGIYWSIPFDALLTSSSRSTASFMWQPLIRDGGAKVGRPINLYSESYWVSPDVNTFMPARPRNDQVAPDDRVEPFQRKR